MARARVSTTFAIYAPLHGWLAMLLDGWRFSSWIVEPMQRHHGHFAVLLVRDR